MPNGKTIRLERKAGYVNRCSVSSLRADVRLEDADSSIPVGAHKLMLKLIVGVIFVLTINGCC